MIYTEKQKFTQWWLWAIFIGLDALLVYGCIQQIILGKPLGDNPVPDIGLVLMSVFMFLFSYLFWQISLKTEIDQTGITLQMKPFFKERKFVWDEISSAEIIQYGFVGYGVRVSTKHGTVYNTKGNKGLAIELKNGEKVLIGTQREDEIRPIIEQLLSSKT